ncbi:MAG: hypothetical protein KDD11_21745 [Acidobacteria bacterium]|nr:hypothetical protein [Acidobacteriota bacterium]
MAKSDKAHESAGPDEVTEAIASLTSEELLALRLKARYYAKGLGRLRRGRDEQDLIQEAMLRTLDGDRKWQPAKVTFVQHLYGAIKSIAYAWRTKSERGDAAEVPDSDHARSSELTVETFGSSSGNPVTALEVREDLNRIHEYFREDRDVVEILAGWEEGMGGPEIQELAEISENEYRAAVRRLRRGLPRIEGLGGFA